MDWKTPIVLRYQFFPNCSVIPAGVFVETSNLVLMQECKESKTSKAILKKEQS